MSYAVPMWAGSGNVSSASGPTDVEVSTESNINPGVYNNAFVCYRVGTAAAVSGPESDPEAAAAPPEA